MLLRGKFRKQNANFETYTTVDRCKNTHAHTHKHKRIKNTVCMRTQRIIVNVKDKKSILYRNPLKHPKLNTPLAKQQLSRCNSFVLSSEHQQRVKDGEQGRHRIIMKNFLNYLTKGSTTNVRHRMHIYRHTTLLNILTLLTVKE